METARLIEALGDPAAYGAAEVEIEVRQTHISVVFLVGDRAYKVKKPVDLGFLDFTTLEKRRRFCEAELRLNRRLAPDVYLDVVPITERGGGLVVGGDGEPIEYAVCMRRLDDDLRFTARLERGDLDEGMLDDLARKLAGFHARADRGGSISSFGEIAVVAGNAIENFDQTAGHVGETVSEEVYGRFRRLTEEAIGRLGPRIEERAGRDVPCDTHGDLHLDHVYLVDGELVIVDCIEFNERFRYADPVADVAFLIMDLAFQGRRDLARSLADSYFLAANDEGGRDLLSFYVAYRAAVRAKVEGIVCLQEEVPREQRERARAKARAHWLLGLGELERPERRPCLLLIGGLPGAGKSTLAADLAAKAGFEVVRTDVVRKEMAKGEKEIYTEEWNDRTYDECLRRSEGLLFEGRRVIVDGSFREEGRRRRFLDAAARRGVPGALLICEARPETARRRLDGRAGDASDADWSVHRLASDLWEEPSPTTARVLRTIPSDGPPSEVCEKALGVLSSLSLWS